MNPNLLGSAPGMGAAYNTKFRRPEREPERTVWVKSEAVRTLLMRDNIRTPRTIGLLWHGVLPGWPEASSN